MADAVVVIDNEPYVEGRRADGLRCLYRWTCRQCLVEFSQWGDRIVPCRSPRACPECGHTSTVAVDYGPDITPMVAQSWLRQIPVPKPKKKRK